MKEAVNEALKRKIPEVNSRILSLVGEEGLEPSLHCWNQILSLARLPIPPFAHITGVAQRVYAYLRFTQPPLARTMNYRSNNFSIVQ